jgi:hypothetical protein
VFVASVIGTLGTILSVYKLIHNVFLGQLRSEHEKLSEAPLSMLIPMLACGGIAFITGVAPGLFLGWVAAAQGARGRLCAGRLRIGRRLCPDLLRGRRCVRLTLRLLGGSRRRRRVRCRRVGPAE